MWQTLLRGMPAVHAWIVLMSLASTTAYRPNITKLAPQTMETKRLKETYGRVYEALKLHQEQTFLGVCTLDAIVGGWASPSTQRVVLDPSNLLVNPRPEIHSSGLQVSLIYVDGAARLELRQTDR